MMTVAGMLRLARAGIVVLVAVHAGGAWGEGESVIDTAHNLSVSGKGSKKHGTAYVSSKEERVCIFCHTPHHANVDGPLWSRDISTLSPYLPYASETIRSRPDQPQGPSRLCLSCHDGTIALGTLVGGYPLDPAMPRIARDPDPRKNTNLTTDLSDDHPISFPYAAAVEGGELEDQAVLAARGITLSQGAYVECTACHDPHNDRNGNFLVIGNDLNGAALCTTCHRKRGWEHTDSTHRTGGSRDPANGPDITRNGCMNCHYVHSAPGPIHLLTGTTIDSTCLGGTCHNGSRVDGNIKALMQKPYAHSLFLEGGVHLANEQLPATVRHVVCVDCHNPHQSGRQGVPLGSPSPDIPPASVPPSVNGPLRGVRGVDSTGSFEVPQAVDEYQICFKCHAKTSAVFRKNIERPLRQFPSQDESLRFSPQNASLHPVAGDRRGTGKSLLVQFQTTMTRVYCSDCHSPMGADEPHMLKAQNYDTYPSAVRTYPLCFRCHDPDYLLNPLRPPNAPSVQLHKSHVLDHTGREVPCSVCHDPHGVPVNPFLINLDTRYAGPNPVYSGGSCTVLCHPSPGVPKRVLRGRFLK